MMRFGQARPLTLLNARLVGADATVLTTLRIAGQRVADIFPTAGRRPEDLRAHYIAWQQHPLRREQVAPSLVFAVVGQAKADGRISTHDEVRILSHMLERWALNRARNYCAVPPALPASPSSSTLTLKPRTHAPRIKH